MNPAIWPSLKGWTPTSADFVTRRAVYGKVHRAPADYRWFAWSGGFGAAGPAPLENDLAFGIEDQASAFFCWRHSPTGAVAVRCYPSRAFDAAGRPAIIEKQVLLVGAGHGLPPAALAFFLLPQTAPLDDSIWWNTWKDPRWKSLDYHLTIADQDCPTIRTGPLDSLLDQGVAELLQCASPVFLAEFYAQLLAGNGLAVLRTETLSPLALAALMLPLSRDATERIALSSGFPSAHLDPQRLTHWTGIVGPATELPPVAETHRLMAEQFVRQLQQSLTQTPILIKPDLSPGGTFLLGFLESDERWFAPGKLTKESLSHVGPWPVVQREDEANFLRKAVASFIAQVEAKPTSHEKIHLQAKTDQLRALLLVLCPGAESLRAVGIPDTRLVPTLLFAGRIEVQDWQYLAKYKQSEFQILASQSLNCVKAMAEEVTTWLEDAASRPAAGQTQNYARQALLLV